MSERRFIDTGILIAVFAEIDQRRRGIARSLVREALQNQHGVINAQVVSEFLQQALQHFDQTMSIDQAHDFLRVTLQPLCQIPQPPDLFHDSLDLHARWGIALPDATILAAAMQAQCTILYTERPLPSLQFGRVKIVDPFK